MKDIQKILNIIILAVTIILIIIAILLYIKQNKVGEFRLSDYAEEISIWKSNIVFGEVLDSTTAKKFAEKMWKEGSEDSVEDWKPYKVSFDKENRVWLVIGSLRGDHIFGSEDIFGGERCILIRQQDGKILAAWFTQ